MSGVDNLSPEALDLRAYLIGVRGCDVCDYTNARAGRELEAVGHARIVKAKERPSGEMRQPYFGIKLTAQGRRAAMALAQS